MNWESIENLLSQIYTEAVAVQGMVRLLRAGSLAHSGAAEVALTVPQVASVTAKGKARVQALIAAVDSLKQELGIP